MAYHEWGEFKAIPVDPRYGISKSGKVINFKSNKILKPVDLPNKYPRIWLGTKDGKRRKWEIHLLVTMTYLGECPKGMEVCHNDGNKKNCNLSNLRYDTHANNMQDRKIHESDRIGEKLGYLTEKDVLSIRIKKSKGESLKSLSLEYKITEANISKICRGETWQYVDGPITKRPIGPRSKKYGLS